MPGSDEQAAQDEFTERAGDALLDEAGMDWFAAGRMNWIRRRIDWRAFEYRVIASLLALIALLLLVLVGLAVVYLVQRGSPAETAATANVALAPEERHGEVVAQTAYGDWTYLCVKRPSDAAPQCSISQERSDPATHVPILRWRIFRGPDGGLIGEWDTVLGINVGQGIAVDAGWDKPARIPFRACLPQGCQAIAGFDADAVGRLAKAEKATATIFPDNSSRGIQVTFSVAGLPEALAALQ